MTDIRWRRLAVAAAFFALIAFAVVRSTLATRLDGLGLDEAYHITAGVAYARTGDYRLNPEHPPLVKLWVGAWLTEDVFELPPFRPLADKFDERGFTDSAVYLTNDPDRVQSRVRAAMLTFSALLLLGFGLAVRRAFGNGMALAALGFLAIDPTVAAHMPVVMTDLPVALLASTAMLLAVVAFRAWRLLDLALAGAALGLTLGAKHSAIIVAVVVVTLGAGMALLQTGQPSQRLKRVAMVAGMAVLSVAVLWGLYGFRFDESREGRDLFNRPLAAKIEDVRSPFMKKSLEVMTAGHLLPRAYVWGLADVIRAGVEGRGYPVYAFGQSYIRKTPFYVFPGLLAVKLPIGLLVLGLIGLGFFAARKIERAWLAPLGGVIGLAVIFLIFLGFSGAGYAGVRHALPVVPALALLGAVAIVSAIAMKSRALRGAVVLAIVGAAVSAVPVMRPWEYYNELVGGTEYAYRYFSDEGLDLTQRTKELARYYDEHIRATGEMAYVDYDTSEEELRRRGIHTLQMRWKECPEEDTSAVISGTFFISAAYLAPSPWYDLAAFREATPIARMGNLFVYRGTFDLPELRAGRLYWRALEAIYSQERDAAKAERLLAESLEIYSNAYFAALELGNLLAERGARDEAIRTFDLARQHAPANDEIKELLAKQIERLRSEPPESVPPLRNPMLE